MNGVITHINSLLVLEWPRTNPGGYVSSFGFFAFIFILRLSHKNLLILLDGQWSEISLIHPDDVDWFLSMDETHHRFSTEGNKGGSTTIRYANSSFARSGDRITKNAHHTTGVYGVTLRGEPLPPLYIVDTKSKNVDNYRIDPRICQGLPIVRGKYGQDTVSSYPSNVALRRKGSMDTSLWAMYNRLMISQCYKGKISKIPVRDSTGKLISGPLIMKTDAGPGRLSKEAESIDFRTEMYDLGMHILLSLPNGTECTAELDQIYGNNFKNDCKKATIRVAGMKMAARVDARKKAKGIDKDQTAVEDLADYMNELGGEEGNADGSESDDDDEVVTLTVNKSKCNVTIGNGDLAEIVNGFPGDPIEKRPFDFNFMIQKVIRAWIYVGFMPMTRNAVNDPKVRHEIGEGGAPEDIAKRMELLVEEYNDLAKQLTTMGFNGALLDIEPPTVKEKEIPADEEMQVQWLLKNKGINRAGGLFKIGNIVANSRVVLETYKRMAVIAKANKKEKQQDKDDSHTKDVWMAIRVFGAWKIAGRPTFNNKPKLKPEDAKAILKALLPIIGKEGEVISNYSSGVKRVDRLLQVSGGTTWEEEMEKVVAETTARDGGGDRLF